MSLPLVGFLNHTNISSSNLILKNYKIYIEPIYSICQLKLLQQHNLNNIFPLYPSIFAIIYLDQRPLRFNHKHILSSMSFDYVHVFSQYVSNGFECFIIQTNRDKCGSVTDLVIWLGFLLLFEIKHPPTQIHLTRPHKQWFIFFRYFPWPRFISKKKV